MSLEKCIQDSIKIYMSSHSRSNKKLIPIHSFISNSIKKCLNKNFQVHSLPYREIVVNGRYNNKKVDVCIKKKQEILGVGSIKFIMSNYKQNANNYFENCTGELINLYKQTNTLFVMIVFDEIPYYNSKHEIKSYHKLNDSDYYKYFKLVQDGYLNNLIILTVSNGRDLQHPQTMDKEKLSNMDFTKFKIKSCYPETFNDTILNFAQKLK